MGWVPWGVGDGDEPKLDLAGETWGDTGRYGEIYGDMGSPNSTLRSMRPGRSSAGSSVSGRLVAIRILTLPRA